MIRDEDGLLTGYVYLDLATRTTVVSLLRLTDSSDEKLRLPAGYSYKWSGEYEFEVRAKKG